jgi:hypothetical protein
LSFLFLFAETVEDAVTVADHDRGHDCQVEQEGWRGRRRRRCHLRDPGKKDRFVDNNNIFLLQETT